MLNPPHGSVEFGVERHGVTHIFNVTYIWHAGYAYGPDARYWRPAEVEVMCGKLVNLKVRGDGWLRFANEWFADQLLGEAFYERVAEVCWRQGRVEIQS